MSTAYLISVQNELVYAISKSSSDFTKGQLLIGSNPDKKSHFLFKIIGFSYLSDLPLPEQSIQSCINFLIESEDLPVEKKEKFDKDNSNFIVIECLLIGQIKNSKLVASSFLPAQFTALSSPDEGQLNFLPKFTGNIPLGDFKNGDKRTNLSFFIDSADLPLHLAVIGHQEKPISNLVTLFFKASILQDNLSLVVIDLDGKYLERIKRDKDFYKKSISENLFKVYRAKNIKATENNLKFSIMEVGLNDISFSFNLSSNLIDDAFIIFHKYRKQWLMQLGTKDSQKLLKEIGGDINSQNMGHLKEIGQSINSFISIKGDIAKSISQSFLNSLNNRKSIIFDLSSMQNQEKLMVSSLIGRTIYEDREQNYSGEYPKTLIVLDGVHKFLTKNRIHSQNIFNEILTNGKKYNLGLIGLSDKPDNISPDYWKNTDFSIFFNFKYWLLPPEITVPYLYGEILIEELNLLEMNEVLMLIPDFQLPLKLALFKTEDIEHPIKSAPG